MSSLSGTASPDPPPTAPRRADQRIPARCVTSQVRPCSRISEVLQGAVSAAARQSRPAAADDVAMPSHDRAGSHDQPHRREALGRQRPGEQRQPRPVRPRQTRMSRRLLTLGDGELMAQHQISACFHHDPAAASPAPTPHGARSGRLALSPQAEEHPTSGQARAVQHRTLDQTDRAPQSICPGDTVLRHPQVHRPHVRPAHSWVAGYGQETGPRYFTNPVDGILVYPRGGMIERLARLAGVEGSQFTVVVNDGHVPFTGVELGL
jgi:hypothetical protein